MSLELGIAKTDKQATASEPTKANVDGGASPSFTKAAWMTPNEYDEPAKKNLQVRTIQFLHE
jgi:hypothetical protein